MPTFYNFIENGVSYSFDDIFVPADIFREGNLWIWGNSGFGRLGNDNAVTDMLTPVTTSAGGSNWKQVFCSMKEQTAAIKSDGTLWTWGRANSGELGANNITTRSTPITTFAGGTNWKQVSCGTNFTSAITTGISPELPLS